jgi:hypothetical protein
MLEGNNSTDITGVTVTFDKLTGPNGYELNSRPYTGDINDKSALTEHLFNYIGKEIELFHIGYPQWNGATVSTGAPYLVATNYRPGSDLTLPQFRFDPATETRVNWHKHVPDLALPMELMNPQNNHEFTVEHGKHQAIWADIYVPNDAPSGTYSGSVVVKINGQVNESVPIELVVRNFALPDEFTVENMLMFDMGYVNERFKNWGMTGQEKIEALQNISKFAQRHRITLTTDTSFFQTGVCRDSVGGYANFVYDNNTKTPCLDPSNTDTKENWLSMLDEWLKPQVTGALFTSENGYDGPGVGRGADVYSIYSYFMSPARFGDDAQHHGMEDIDTMTDVKNQAYPMTKLFLLDWAPLWNKWFAQNAPHAEYFYYMRDEDARILPWDNELARLLDVMSVPTGERHMSVFKSKPVSVVMSRMKNGDTSNHWNYRPAYGPYEHVTDWGEREAVRVHFVENFPYVDKWYLCNGSGCEHGSRWQDAMTFLESGPEDHGGFATNGHMPAQASFALEGSYLRAGDWINQKFQPNKRRFYFMGNLWINDAFGSGPNKILNFWEDLHTHGNADDSWDNIKGYAAYEFYNGDGLLMYPGTDYHYQQHSYGINGAFASLRIKKWRRGIQDAEYIKMAKVINSTSVEQIIQGPAPRGYWETPSAVPELAGDYFDSNKIAYSMDGNVYNTALEQLSQIIVDNGGPIDTIKPQITPRSFIATTTTNTSPSYTFYTTEAGTVSYTGSCGNGNITQAQEGLNTVTYSNLSNGAYTDCIIRVTDQSSNQSPELLVKEFIVNVDGISDIRADVDNSGTLTVSDAQKILRKSVGLTVTDWYQGVHTGDVNCTGAVSVADALLVLRKSVNLPTPSWCDIQF